MGLPSHLLEAKKRMELSSKQEEETKAETEAPAEDKQPEVKELDTSAQEDDVVSLDVEESEDSPATNEAKQQDNSEIDKLRKDVALYKARWETLQGKFRSQDAEIARLKSELASKDSEIDSLRKSISDLQAHQKQLSKKKIIERIQNALSDEEKAIHGDTLPVISKVAEELFSQQEEALSSIRKDMEEQKKKDAENALQYQISSFHSAFRSAVPDADKIAADPSWQSFTSKRDKFSGKLISEIWEEHVSRMNVKGLVNIIDAWRKLSGASKPPSAPKTPTLSAAAPQPKVSEQGRFKYSEYKQASELYRQNIHDQVAKKRLDELRKKFEEAKIRNLVDYSA